MRVKKYIVSGISIFLLLSTGMTALADQSSDNFVTDEPQIITVNDLAPANNDMKVIVRFRGTAGPNERSLVKTYGGKIKRDFPRLNALAVEMPFGKVKALSGEPNVLYVEEDRVRYAQGAEDTELEPALNNGLYGLVTTNATRVQSVGVTGNGVNVCFADTAVDITHPDIAPNLIGTENFNPGPVNLQSETHGTHVGGIIAAALNNVGVRGMAYGSRLYHARVLDSDGSGTVSEVIAGVDDLANNHSCKIISLSLGGADPSQTEKDFYDGLYNRGVLVVASAGNNGQYGMVYPANYPSVLAVGAVDKDNNHPSFSSIGNNLDLSAPGVRVLSSVPNGTGWNSSVTIPGGEIIATGINYSGTTSGITGTLYNCGYGGAGECPSGVNGNIALIQRGGGLSFQAKLMNAKIQGATAAIVYNNAPGELRATLLSPGDHIPGVTVTETEGAILVGRLGSPVTVLNKISDWDHYSGTSMAAPYVAGAAALVWSVNPGLTNVEVESILKDTAKDLGSPGFDPIFGYGLVNVEKAVNAATPIPNPPPGAIPEFPGMIIPVVSLIGILFIFGKRRQ